MRPKYSFRRSDQRGQSQNRLSLQRMRRTQRQVGGPVPGLRSLEYAYGDHLLAAKCRAGAFGDDARQITC